MDNLLQFNLYMVMLVVVILNGLDSGSIVFFNQNVVRLILGEYSRFFYMAVGVAAVILAYNLVMRMSVYDKEKEMML